MYFLCNCMLVLFVFLYIFVIFVFLYCICIEMTTRMVLCLHHIAHLVVLEGDEETPPHLPP